MWTPIRVAGEWQTKGDVPATDVLSFNHILFAKKNILRQRFPDHGAR
jgi:hypothetical protein